MSPALAGGFLSAIPPGSTCWLVDLRHLSTGTCKLLSGARSQCPDGDLLESSHWIFTGASATCPCPHCEAQPTSISPGEPSRPPSRSGPGFHGVTDLGPNTSKTFYVLSQSRVCFPPVLWRFCTQAPLASKPNALGTPASDARSPGWGAWQWGSELSLLWENLCNIIIFQFVSCLPNGYGIWLNHGNAPLSCCGFFFVFGCRISFLLI